MHGVLSSLCVCCAQAVLGTAVCRVVMQAVHAALAPCWRCCSNRAAAQQWQPRTLLRSVCFHVRCRVGRTARMGRSGAAIAYLLPHEATYVDFLRLRKVPLAEAPAELGQLHEALPDMSGSKQGQHGQKQQARQQQQQAQQQQQQEEPGELHALCARLRQEAEGDREVMEKGVKAYVSYVRGYKEHHCKFIFR
jgi:hypothetical protein